MLDDGDADADHDDGDHHRDGDDDDVYDDVEDDENGNGSERANHMIPKLYELMKMPVWIIPSGTSKRELEEAEEHVQQLLGKERDLQADLEMLEAGRASAGSMSFPGNQSRPIMKMEFWSCHVNPFMWY